MCWLWLERLLGVPALNAIWAPHLPWDTHGTLTHTIWRQTANTGNTSLPSRLCFHCCFVLRMVARCGVCGTHNLLVAGSSPAGPTTPFGRAGPRRTIPALHLPVQGVPASRSHASRRYASGLHPAGPTTPFGRAGPRRTIPALHLPAQGVPASRSHASRRCASGLHPAVIRHAAPATDPRGTGLNHWRETAAER
jgi:hypothetical protein